MSSTLRFRDAFDALHEAASSHTGWHDFGPADYHEGLRRVLESFDEDIPFTEPGRQAAFGALVGTLISRLYTQEGWKRHPEYAQVPLARPLVITGLPRTGSMALHKLMSMDPQFQGMELWLMSTPMVRPPRDTWDEHPCHQAFVAVQQQVHAQLPELAYIHEMAADAVDECINVLQQSFVSNRFACPMGPATGYEAWWWQQSERGSYRRYADVLRLVGLADQGRRWLLKNPGHLWDLESLFEIFPDACVIQTHRDPAKSIPSVCSLLEVTRRLFLGQDQPLLGLGVSEALKWQHALQRAAPVRRRHERQFFDLRQQDFLAEPMGTIRAIYQRFELELSAETEARMRRWLLEQPRAQKEGHRYEASRYGLSEGLLREMFAGYIRRYELA